MIDVNNSVKILFHQYSIICMLSSPIPSYSTMRLGLQAFGLSVQNL